MRHDIPHKCHVCGGELQPRERPEGFCDRCLKAAQAQPFLKADKRDKAGGIR